MPLWNSYRDLPFRRRSRPVTSPADHTRHCEAGILVSLPLQCIPPSGANIRAWTTGGSGDRRKNPVLRRVGNPRSSSPCPGDRRVHGASRTRPSRGPSWHRYHSATPAKESARRADHEICCGSVHFVQSLQISVSHQSVAWKRFATWHTIRSGVEALMQHPSVPSGWNSLRQPASSIPSSSPPIPRNTDEPTSRPPPHIPPQSWQLHLLRLPSPTNS